MAPSRPGARNINGGVPDDTRSDASGPTSSARHEVPKPFAQTPSDKRRPAAIPAPVAPTPQTQSQQHQQQLQLQQQAQQHEIIEGIAWDRMPISLLQEYRSANLLRTPSASTQYSSAVISAGIGKKSASYRHRQPQDSLLSAVRRHFNNQAINEHDVIVNFLYSVKNHDRAFRNRFPPTR